MNTLPFLPERFETIFAQSFNNWELLVYDSYSDDGGWEYVSEMAARNSSIRAWQGPREGPIGSWSPCLREARGEYVYIATSDDTMPPNCLERLVAALDGHPECDLAHCSLRAIDETGREDPLNRWWMTNSTFARSSGELIGQCHVRKAPFDGLLHLIGESVYVSMTQLLIRRSLFEKVGYFESRWGSSGDFAWNMRASLVANTIHVPDTWGGWRLHANQATDQSSRGSGEYIRNIESMIEDTISNSEELFEAPAQGLPILAWASLAREHRDFSREISDRTHPLSRRTFIGRQVAAGSRAARIHLKSKLLGRAVWPEAGPNLIRDWLEGAGVEPVLVPVREGQKSLSAISSRA